MKEGLGSLVVIVLALSGCTSAADHGSTEGAGTGGLPVDTGGAPGTGGTAGAGGTTSTLTDPATEEQAVYAALLAQKYAASFYVIQAETWDGAFRDYPLAELLADLRAGYPDLSGETTASYQARNAVADPIASNMHLAAEYVVLTAEELGQIPSSEEFSQRYPGASGVTQLSRVGFDSSLEQALVCVANHADPLAETWTFYVLAKSAAGWVVNHEVSFGLP